MDHFLLILKICYSVAFFTTNTQTFIIIRKPLQIHMTHRNEEVLLKSDRIRPNAVKGKHVYQIFHRLASFPGEMSISHQSRAKSHILGTDVVKINS